jgi:anti-anti-sigma regulatory factor
MAWRTVTSPAADLAGCSGNEKERSMSGNQTVDAHIAYDLIDETDPKVVVIEFLSRSIIDPGHARELGEQLHSLFRAHLPRRFVIDFKDVRMLGSRAFAEIATFARNVRVGGGKVTICRIPEMVRLGATLIGLDDQAEFVQDRQSAIDGSKNPVEFVTVGNNHLSF